MRAMPTIRPATEADAPFLALCSLIASRAHIDWGPYDVLFPAPDAVLLARLERLARAPAPSFHHWSRRFIAELDGQPAASISTYTAGAAADEALLAALVTAFSPAELALIAARQAEIAGGRTPFPDGAWVLELVATLPEARGNGLARALIEHALDVGRHADHTIAAISYEIGNPAGRLYDAAGFQFSFESRDPVFEAKMRVPGFRLVTRSL
jgi:GNAT superfamily N-acetyltransferase